MRASAPRFTPLTEAQYDELKTQVDPTYGAGYALYVSLSQHRNIIGTSTDLSRTFAGHLTQANNSRLAFDQVLPSYAEYAATVEEFLDESEPAPAPRPPRTRQRYTPAAGDGGTEAPAWFAGFAGNFERWIHDVDDTVENHEDRISALERGEVRQDDGIAKVGLAFAIGLVLGIIALILLVGIVGVVPGIVLGIATFLLGTGIAVALLNRNTASPR